MNRLVCIRPPQGQNKGYVLRTDLLSPAMAELVKVSREYLRKQAEAIALKLEAIKVPAVTANGLPFRKLFARIDLRQGRFFHRSEQTVPFVLALWILKRGLKPRREVVR